MPSKSPTVISLVPSWTETLIEAGVSVVGRTRFCIHPEQSIKNIPAVGGTKSIDLEIIKAISPEYILVDKQENTKEMAEQLINEGFKLLITDVTDFESVISDLTILSQKLENESLNDFAKRYQKIVLQSASPRNFKDAVLAGEWKDFDGGKPFAYVIWKNPFMVVGRSTFIGAVLLWFGIDLEETLKTYPEISEDELKTKFCLFSSEPFPFVKHFDSLIKNGFQGVVVDGECISWFGIRNLKFIEGCLK